MIKLTRPWEFTDNQEITIQDKVYNVHAAISLAETLPVQDMCLADMNISYQSPCNNTFRSFMEHVQLVQEANLDYPILLNEDGSVIDGKHRLAKAILNKDATIKVKRFITDPAACFTWV